MKDALMELSLVNNWALKRVKTMELLLGDKMEMTKALMMVLLLDDWKGLE